MKGSSDLVGTCKVAIRAADENDFVVVGDSLLGTSLYPFSGQGDPP